jgi:hypothetical protein
VNVNGLEKLPQSPEALEARHFELTRQLFELRARLRSRQGLPSGQVGHVRKQAQALEAEIELVELALGAAKLESLTTQKAQSEPPRSRAFLQSFYQAAKEQLPPQLVERLESAAHYRNE